MTAIEPQLLSEPILRGRLQDLDVSSLLSAVQLGRQYLTLEVYDAAGDCTGVVAVKAGQIVSASVDGYTGTEAVRRLLQRRESAEFRVLLQPKAASVETESLGTLATIRQTYVESPTRTRVLQGALSKQLSFDDVLRGLAFTRQHLTLALSDPAGHALGEVTVKANKVLSVRAGELLALPALHQLQRAPSGSHFVLFAEAEDAAQLHPLGTLGTVEELLSHAHSSNGVRKPSAPDTDNAGNDPIPVMDGNLGDLDVASILHVAGASRQYTCVSIFDDQRTPLGTMHLKGGHLVSAQAQEVTGLVAVRRLLHSPRDFSFLVQRYPHAPEVTSSLGTIGEVLTRAALQPTAAIAPLSIERPQRRDAPNSAWLGGAAVGAGFVLLGSIATALVLRTPAPAPAPAPITTISPISMPPAEIAQPPALPRAAAPLEPVDSAEVEAAKAPVPADGPPSRATIASLQAGLRQLGYETGPIDGVLGPRTVAAIKAFQYVEHLTADGTLSAPTRAVLLRRISEP